MGPLMLDIAGTELQPEDVERLNHPQCAGLILFSRNYESPEQILALTRSVRQSVKRPCLIGVDQEGGRVQRFREGFFDLPAQRRLGELFEHSPQEAIRMANSLGWLMASEVRAVDVDFSFAPVLDLDYGSSSVIGDRSLHASPETVTSLARAYIWGMKRAGMPAVAKHFPGHGFVKADSHTDVAVDPRPMDEIEASDLVPFSELIGLGLEAVMPAHVIYEACDPRPAGFSSFWLQTVLRGQLGFQGLVVSDDLNMAAAADFGGPVERSTAALEAGCNLLLMCNNPSAADDILEGLEQNHVQADASTLSLLRGRGQQSWTELHADKSWKEAEGRIAEWVT